MKPALLVVDIQNAWLEDKDLRKSVEERLDTINAAIGWFRKNGLPMVVISHRDDKTGVVPGTKAFEFLEAVEIRDTDTRVTKHYPNSFAKTGLESLLRKKGCDSVVICGLSANWCVLGTFFGALDCDLIPYLLKVGVASSDEGHIRFAEETCDSIDLPGLRKLLSK